MHPKDCGFCRGLSPNKLAALTSGSGSLHEGWFQSFDTSQELWIVISHLELVSRNLFSARLLDNFGDEFFRDGMGKLFPEDVARLNRARQHAVKRSLKDESCSRIIENLNFGFWTRLFTKRYESTFWAPILKSCLCSNAPRKRSVLEARFRQALELRNRIAHHETILKPRFEGALESQLELLSWISPDVHQELQTRYFGSLHSVE